MDDEVYDRLKHGDKKERILACFNPFFRCNADEF